MVSFTYRNFNGHIPPTGELDAADNVLLAQAQTALEAVGESIQGCHFKEGIKAAFALAQEANRYLDGKAPWKAIKQDKEAAARSLAVSLGVIGGLATMLYPYLPFSSEKVYRLLGFSGDVRSSGWALKFPLTGQALASPEPLFTKLDDEVVERETAKLGA